MSLDVDGITAGSGGLIIPVMVPQGAESMQVLERIATAVEALGQKTGEASKATEKSTEAAKESESTWKQLAETYTYVTGAAENIIGKLNSVITTIADLSSEQDRLSAQSARLGLDFDAAAEAAGIFTDETEAMGAAVRLSQAGLAITQEQLNALTRTAGGFAAATGTSTAQAIEHLTQGLVAGSAEGLRPFGADLAALSGESHTAEERLRALVAHARNVVPAVDDASHAVARFKDQIEDAERSLASGFVTRLRELDAARSALARTGDDAESMTDKLHDAGATAATMFFRVYGFVNLMAEGAAHGVTAVLSLSNAVRDAATNPLAAGEAFTRYQATMADSAERVRTAFRQMLAEGSSGTGGTGGAAGAAGAAGAGRTATGFSRGADEATSDSLGPDIYFGSDDADLTRKGNISRRMARGSRNDGVIRSEAAKQAALNRLRNERIAQLLGGTAGEDLTSGSLSDATGLGHVDPREAVNELSPDMDSSKGGLLGAERQAGSSAESRFSDFTKDRDDQRRAERERRGFEQRYQAARTFTERWEDLHHRQVSATEEAAGAMDNALGALGTSLSKHFESIVKGQETVGQALKGILTDTLDSIAKESFTKGGFYAAEAIAKLVLYDYPGAATAAAASAAYFAAGATATGLGAAVSGGGSAPAAPAGGGSAPRSERASTGAANDNATSGQTIVNHFYAPVIGGRTATDAEVGSRMDRYTDATSRRQTRAR